MRRGFLLLLCSFIVGCGTRTQSGDGGGDGGETAGSSTEETGDEGESDGETQGETGEEEGEVCGDGVVDDGEDCEPQDGDPLCNDDCTRRGALQHEVELGRYSPVRVGAGSQDAVLAGLTDDGVMVAAVSLEDGSVTWLVESLEGTTVDDRPLDVLVTPDDELLVLTTTEAAQLGPDERTTIIAFDGEGAEIGRVDAAEGQWLVALAWAEGVVAVGDDGLVASVGLGPLEIQLLAMLGAQRDFVDVAGVGEGIVAVSQGDFVTLDGGGGVVTELIDPDFGPLVSVNGSDVGTVLTVGVLDGVVPETTLWEGGLDGLESWAAMLEVGLEGEVFRWNDERVTVGRTFADFSGDGLYLRRASLEGEPIWLVQEPMDGFVYGDAALGPEGQVVVGGPDGLRIYRP